MVWSKCLSTGSNHQIETGQGSTTHLRTSCQVENGRQGQTYRRKHPTNIIDDTDGDIIVEKKMCCLFFFCFVFVCATGKIQT
jgi:hypothetical protein